MDGRWTATVYMIFLGVFLFFALVLHESNSTWKRPSQSFNPLSRNPTKWSNTLKTIRRQQPTNCLCLVIFWGWCLKGLQVKLEFWDRSLVGKGSGSFNHSSDSDLSLSLFHRVEPFYCFMTQWHLQISALVGSTLSKAQQNNKISTFP